MPVAELPEEEVEELRLIYQARGLPEEEAYSLLKRLLDDPEAPGARGTADTR